MTRRNFLFAICLITLTISLAAGFLITEQWVGFWIAIITGFAWYLARKYSDSWLLHVCLVASVSQAVIGTLTGFPPLLAIFSSGIALAVWDLIFLNASLTDSSYAEQTRRYESSHLQSLAWAVVLGLVMAGLGRLLHIQTPFIFLVLGVVLMIVGLDLVLGYIKKTK
jgi:hypothetical protein